METLGLMYEAMTDYGEVRVSVVKNYLQTLFLLQPEEYYDRSRINVIQTEKSPQEVLEEFEKIVFQNLEDVLAGCSRDVYRINPQFKNVPLHTTFLSRNANEYHKKQGEMKERKSDENDRLIPQRILGLYDEYIKKFS